MLIRLITNDELCTAAAEAVAARERVQLVKCEHESKIFSFITESNPEDIVIYDPISFKKDPTDDLIAALTKKPKHLMVLSGGTTDALSYLDKHPDLRNIVGRNEKHLELELHGAVITLIPSYTPTPLRIVEEKANHVFHTIYDYDKKDRYLNELETVVRSMDCHKSISTQISTIAWELLMNAIFDASYTNFELPSFESSVRTESIMLGTSEAVHFSYTFDEDRIMVGVKDYFGSLNCSDIITHLCKSLNQDTFTVNLGEGGAGVGMYMVLNMADALYINVKPGRMTDIVAVIFKTKKLKERRHRNKTLCFHEEAVQMDSALSFNAKQDGQLLEVHFDGKMNEHVDYSSLNIKDVNDLRFFFRDVTMMNSIGIQLWLKFIKSIDSDTLVTFSECPVHFIEQLNVFVGLTGGHDVIVDSCFVPYFCEKCDESHDIMLNLAHTFPEKKYSGFSSKEQRCPACDEPMEFDEIEDSFFSFLERVRISK